MKVAVLRGVNGNQSDNTAPSSGAVYVFARSLILGSPTWIQQAYVKASNTEAGDEFGMAIALSKDSLAVSATHESSSSKGINGVQDDNSAPFSGAVYVFLRTGTSWGQQAYIKASNTVTLAVFGSSIALLKDTLVVGSASEASTATGVDGNQDDRSQVGTGAVYVFEHSGSVWIQQHYIKASNASPLDTFGSSIALSDEILAVGATLEDSNAMGIDGDQLNDNAADSGAAYVFRRTNGTWIQQAYMKASNAETKDWFGAPLAVSGDTVVAGAVQEDGGQTGINGNQLDNRAEDSGAVYIFR